MDEEALKAAEEAKKKAADEAAKKAEEEAAAKKANDDKKLSDEAAEWRRKLREAEAKLAAKEEELSKRDKEKLEADKKWEDLYRAEEKKTADLNKRMNDLAINTALKDKLREANAVDPDVVSLAIDRSKLALDELGNVKGLDDAVSSFKALKPNLFAAAAAAAAGADPNAARPTGAPTTAPSPNQAPPPQNFANATKEELDSAINNIAESLKGQ